MKEKTKKALEKTVERLVDHERKSGKDYTETEARERVARILEDRDRKRGH